LSVVTPTISIAALGEGETIVVRAGGAEVLLCNVQGQFYAVDAQCSHARQTLATGRLRGYQISCPLHGARFDVRTGACTAAPATRPIRSFPVFIEGGKVCVQVN